MGMNLGERYANAIHQLLPKGIAWQEKGVCTETLLGRWIRGNSEELARFQVWFDTLLKWSIERYGDTPTGWSADEYETLIARKFGLNVTVTPNAQANDPHLPTVDNRNRYRFTIDVDESDLDAINSLLTNYLDEYKQSHTDYVIRTRANASMPAAPAAGIMAIKFDKWDGLHIGANTATSADMGLLVFASQPNAVTLSADANSVAPVATGLFILARQQHSPINVNTDSKAASGMHVFTHATG